MHIVRIDKREDVERNIGLIHNIIKHHGIIVYPTDTVNGIGCSPYDEVAVDRLFAIKKRGLERTVPILVSSVSRARELAKFDRNAEALSKRFWPGALTMVLRARDRNISKRAVKDMRIGVRMPAHNTAILLAECFGGAIIGTSANISGEAPLEGVEQIKNSIPMVDMIVTSSIPPNGKCSTVVDPEAARIIREGSITNEEVYGALNIQGE